MANVLIVDDSRLIRSRLRTILEGLGHNVVSEAENGKEAIGIYKAKEKEIDLITLDIEMPGINGLEVVRLIREQNPLAAIVMISSVEDRSKVLKAIQLGAKHYFVKPLVEDKIREVIDKVLGQVPQADPIAVSRMQVSSSTADSTGTRVLRSESLTSLPFELFHMDERTILIIRDQITDANVSKLFHCLQGLLYFRKMKFVLEFWVPAKHAEGSNLLLDFVNDVRARQGKAAVVTDDPKYYAHWVSILRDDVYRTYKEIKW